MLSADPNSRNVTKILLRGMWSYASNSIYSCATKRCFTGSCHFYLICLQFTCFGDSNIPNTFQTISLVVTIVSRGLFFEKLIMFPILFVSIAGFLTMVDKICDSCDNEIRQLQTKNTWSFTDSSIATMFRSRSLKFPISEKYCSESLANPCRKLFWFTMSFWVLIFWKL